MSVVHSIWSAPALAPVGSDTVWVVPKAFPAHPTKILGVMPDKLGFIHFAYSISTNHCGCAVVALPADTPTLRFAPMTLLTARDIDPPAGGTVDMAGQWFGEVHAPYSS